MNEIEKYITKRYYRWLDYSTYHCGVVGLTDEAIDVLNEVMGMLLAKPQHELERLYQAKKAQYRALDFFVLRMIKLNATSNTSPYRSKYKSVLTSENVDYTKIEIEDIQRPEPDRAGIVFERMQLVRCIFERIELTELERKVFEYRFFQDMQFRDWSGNESLKKLYESYNYVRALIRAVVCRLGIITQRTYKSLPASVNRRVNIASRLFVEQSDKRLITNLKRRFKMNDDEETYNYEDKTEEDYRKLMDGDAYRTVGVVGLELDGVEPANGVADLGLID